jgi:Arc/MetJ-type ribon-helix-helix transcriptional regulator
MKRKDMRYWNIPVTSHLDDVIEKAVRLNAHVSKSDFIRCAAREKLARMGLEKELNKIEDVATDKRSGVREVE